MKRWLGAMALCVAASACDPVVGGDGGNDAGSDPECGPSKSCPTGKSCSSSGVCVPNPATDREPPTLASYEPMQTTRVSVRTPLRFTFDEPVVVAADGVQVVRAGTLETVAATHILSPDSRILTVEPVVNPPLTLTLRFPGVRDLAGNLTTAQPPDFSYPVWMTYPSPQEDTSTTTLQPALAIDAEGRPVLAWSEGISSRKLYVDRRDGAVWTSLGGGAVNVGASAVVTQLDPALASRGAHLVLAWEEFVAPDVYTLHVRRWTGTAWEALPGTLSASTLSGRIHLALRANGTPVVGLFSGSFLRVFAHTGTAWQELGSLAETDVEHLNPALALDPNDVPYILYERRQISTSTTTAQVRRWNASTSAWDALAGSPHQFGAGLVVDTAGRPWVTYKSSADALVVTHWTGSGWSTPERLNSTIHTRVNIRDPRMTIEPNGTLVAAWVDNEYELWVARNSGTGWQVTPRAVNPALNNQWTKDFAIAAGPTGPWVTFTDRMGDDLYLSQLNR